jgi:superfamily I DNA/RNA helicase
MKESFNYIDNNYLTIYVRFITFNEMARQIIWNSENKAIFNWVAIGRGHSVIDAVAGSGKTSSIVESLNRSNCKDTLYCVFGKAAQIEAAQKITNKKVSVVTYHSLGYRFLRNYWKGVKASPYCEYNRVAKLFPDAPKQIHFQVSRAVSFLKNTYIIPSQRDVLDTLLIRNIDGANHKQDYPLDKLAEMALASLESSLVYPSKDKTISFEDMFWVPLRLNLLKPTYNLIFSDESQDLNLPQFEMLKAVCNPKGRMCLVGDPLQSIFWFRGSMQDSMEKFQKELNAQKFTLSVCYRCPKKIIGMIQLLNPLVKAADDAIEGEVVTINTDKMLGEIRPDDVILSRVNYLLVTYCLKLIRKGTPAYILGREIGTELKEILNGLEAQNIPDFFDKLQKWRDDRVNATSGWLATRAAALIHDKFETLKVLAENVLELSQIEQKINRLFMDANDVKIPSVICSSIHKFKGNQADNVYVLSDSFANRCQQNEFEIREESNLRYVSQSRSKVKLAFVSTK